MQIVKLRSSAFQIISDTNTKEDVNRIISNYKFQQIVKKDRKNENSEITKDDINQNEINNENEIIDFDLKTIIAPKLHQNTKKWIIFSDLHVKR